VIPNFGIRQVLPPEQRKIRFTEGPAPGVLKEDDDTEEIDVFRLQSTEEFREAELEVLEENDNPIIIRQSRRWLDIVCAPPSRYFSDHVHLIAVDDEHRVAHHNARDWRGGTLTAKEWSELKRAFGGCAYCGAGGNMSLEHMRPVSRGGRTEVANVVPACWACNREKATSTVEEWLSGDRLTAFEDRRRAATRRMAETKTP
jgi:hypothetical protein